VLVNLRIVINGHFKFPAKTNVRKRSRRLGDEMRNMSMEKSRQREQELHLEMERLQAEIKTMQKSAEESANISQQLSKEVSYRERGHQCDRMVSRNLPKAIQFCRNNSE